MKLFFLLFFLLTLSVMPGCKDTCSCKKVACPAFHDALFEKWFPYSADAQVVFATNTGRKDTILVLPGNKSQSYEANQGCYNASSGCGASTTVNFTNALNNGLSKGNIFYTAVTPFTSPDAKKDISFTLYAFVITAKDINLQGLVPGTPSVTAQNFNNIVLNGSNFSNVQLLQKDTTGIKYTGPYKIYLSQNTGLVAYETYPLNELWVKQ